MANKLFDVSLMEMCRRFDGNVYRLTEMRGQFLEI